jgi:uncharacterized small protein (DUF1192 family)
LDGSMGRSVGNSKGFRRNAAECRAIAGQAKTEQLRMELLSTAELWERLAADRELIRKLRKDATSAKKKRSRRTTNRNKCRSARITSGSRMPDEKRGESHSEPLQTSAVTPLEPVRFVPVQVDNTCTGSFRTPIIGDQTWAEREPMSTHAKYRHWSVRKWKETLFVAAFTGIVSCLEVFLIAIANHV